MNSVLEKQRIASDESDKNMVDELDILKWKILQTFDQICKKNKRFDSNSMYVIIALTYATSVNKGRN